MMPLFCSTRCFSTDRQTDHGVLEKSFPKPTNPVLLLGPTGPTCVVSVSFPSTDDEVLATDRSPTIASPTIAYCAAYVDTVIVQS